MTAAADSSVIVAAFAGWHENHEVALNALARHRPRLIGHCALETFSLLTRLPFPNRVRAEIVVELIEAHFPGTALTPSSGLWSSALEVFRDRKIRGGAVYDGLVGLVAAENGLELLTLDRRAQRTYEACGVAYQPLVR